MIQVLAKLVVAFLLVQFLNAGASRGILNCPLVSTDDETIAESSGMYKNEDGSIECLLSIPTPNPNKTVCQELKQDEINVFRIIGDYQRLSINCSASFNLFLDYDGQQPTEALSLNYFKNVNVTQENKGRPNISLTSFGLTVTIHSIQRLFQDYLSQRNLDQKQSHANEYFHKTQLSSPILYSRTGKITIRGKSQNLKNGNPVLQFYFFFEEPEVRGKVNWITNEKTRRPLVTNQQILVPCKPTHYINQVQVSMVSYRDVGGRKSKRRRKSHVNVTSEGTFDPILGFKIPLVALKGQNLKDVQFKCSIRLTQGETWMSIPRLRGGGEPAAPPLLNARLPALYGLDRLNLTRETAEGFSLSQAVMENGVSGDLFCTLRCTFNELPENSSRVQFSSYGKQIKTAEEFKFRREFVLPIFAHLSYYVKIGSRIEGSRDFVISEENNFGMAFCTSGATYKYQEYTAGLDKLITYMLPFTAPWADLPYEKVRWPSVFIQLHRLSDSAGKSSSREIYADEKVTFVCKILKHVMVAPILWFAVTADNTTTLLFQDEDFAEDSSFLRTTLSVNVTGILCSSSIWTNNELWKEASLNLTVQSPKQDFVAIFIGVSVAIFCVSSILLAYWKLPSRSSKKIFSMREIHEFRSGVSPQWNSNDYSLPLAQPYAVEYEIPEHQFQINKTEVLGSGEYGIVLKGRVKGQPVAVKTIKEEDGKISKEEVKSLLSEIKIMGYLGSHPNLIRFIGASTLNLRRGIVYVFVEFCEHGNLLNHLKNNKQKFLDSNYLNANEDLANIGMSVLDRWSLEIAKGMDFLASKKVIHADLAARNILLTRDGTAKITDFGLSRQLYNYSLYMKKSQNPLPWRWMAVESLSDLQFSLESDIWSYGVLLWEIYSLGALPFPNMSWTNEFVQSLVQGFRLARPSLMSSQMYTKLVLLCWEKEPDQRPHFDTIIHFLEQNPTENLQRTKINA